MVITVLSQKYKCGCDKGISCSEETGILSKLNAIIEWSEVTWPVKRKEGTEKDVEPDTEFLGPDPELKPGNCFLYEGQVIACDSEDRLVLILSETGWGSIERVVRKIILPEFDVWGHAFELDKVSVEKCNSIPESYTEITPKYYLMKEFKERYLTGRFSSTDILKVQFDGENYILPEPVYINNWSIWYDKEDLPEERVEITIKDIFGWIYNNSTRIKVEKKEEPVPSTSGNQEHTEDEIRNYFSDLVNNGSSEIDAFEETVYEYESNSDSCKILGKLCSEIVKNITIYYTIEDSQSLDGFKELSISTDPNYLENEVLSRYIGEICLGYPELTENIFEVKGNVDMNAFSNLCPNKDLGNF